VKKKKIRLAEKEKQTLGSPINEIATLSLLFIPPLYFPACLSAIPPW